ncbi:MAG: signal peptidase I [Gammaproteobacteria bacterium]|nr:signal peptidase I [Gammaproteobacteria bacterium]
MIWDFSAYLLVALVITGVISGVYRLVRGRDGSNAEQKEPLVVEYARAFFPVILVVFVLRAFVAEPFRIPSGSMIPTLQVGDFILVNKFSYGIRFPLFNREILSLGQPQRGDVVVFRYPPEPEIDYIKRVVGLPGDRITYVNKQLHINGEPVVYEAIDEGQPFGINRFVENFGAGGHRVQTYSDRGIRRFESVVPEGHYFVMGDNRDNSKDSRVWGFVPAENLVGKAFMIWMNWDSSATRVKWGRIGQMIN